MLKESNKENNFNLLEFDDDNNDNEENNFFETNLK